MKFIAGASAVCYWAMDNVVLRNKLEFQSRLLNVIYMYEYYYLVCAAQGLQDFKSSLIPNQEGKKSYGVL